MKEEEAGGGPSAAAHASFRGAVRAAAAATKRYTDGDEDDDDDDDDGMPPPGSKRIRRELLPSASASCNKQPNEPPAPLVKWEPSTPTTAPEGMACALCGGREDGGPNERLMFCEPGVWVHLNCAYWSSETHENAADGTIVAVPGAVKRAKRLDCSHCGKPGASIGCCTHRCKHTYHFECAIAANCQMMVDKRLYCEEHKSTKQAMKGAVWDAQTPISRPLTIQQSKKYNPANSFALPPELWIRSGALTIMSCGVPPSNRGEAPDGFLAYRTHWSAVHSGKKCGYRLAIRDTTPQPALMEGEGEDEDEDEEKPPRELEFEILCEDSPDKPIIAPTAARAVREMFSKLYAAQPSAAAVTALFPYEPGYFFGWLHTPCQTRLHGDPNAPVTHKFVLPTNPSGCARTEPIRRLVLNSAGNAAASAAKPKPTEAEEAEAYLTREQLPAGNVEKIKGLNALAWQKFKVARSPIHGWGLFVKEPIQKGEMLIEYQGALIRSSLNESMLRKYTREKVFGATDGSYIFRLDEDTQVDATMYGNIARFMNHSCAPNAYSRIVEVGKSMHDKHIIVFAMRDLQVGEELQYDYQFALGGEKIECHCGAPNCWGRMN